MPGTPFVVAALISVLLFAAAGVWLWLAAREKSSEQKTSDKLAAQIHVLEEQSTSGILIIDGEGFIRKVNQSAEQMFGYSEEELLGENISRLTRRIPPSGSDGINLETVRKDGSRLQMHCCAVEIPTSGSESYLFFDKPRAQSAGELEPRISTLAVAERVVNRIVRQLEGLLTMINGYTELALYETGENNPLRKDLEEIATASDAASSLTRHLLAFAGNQPIPKECVDVNALIEGLQPKFEAVQVEVSAEHLYVMANRQCLQQIVALFCGSASHRAGPQAAKQIITRRRRQGPAEYAAISISDGGPALPPATLDCLFEPLFLDQEGLGVELSAVYGMVKNLGGSISVASDTGRGTTFEILIPLTQGPNSANIIQAAG